MKIGIYGQPNNETTKKYVYYLIDIFKQKKIDFQFEEKFYKYLKKDNPAIKYDAFKDYYELNSSFDLFFSVGGDGTFLRSITLVRDHNIPIIGINTGRLGFLATIQKDDIESAVAMLLKNEYTIQKRSLLRVSTNETIDELKDLNFALNEITISRKNTASMITVETYLDDEYLTTYWSDGLIISTPTGSTGYSLSCGGPIISPTSRNLVLTPIAPHSLSVRPLVIPLKTKIEIKVDSRANEALLTLDSRVITITNKTKIVIEKNNFSIKTVQLNNRSFIKTLREKLLWGEDQRN